MLPEALQCFDCRACEQSLQLAGKRLEPQIRASKRSPWVTWVLESAVVRLHGYLFAQHNSDSGRLSSGVPGGHLGLAVSSGSFAVDSALLFGTHSLSCCAGAFLREDNITTAVSSLPPFQWT